MGGSGSKKAQLDKFGQLLSVQEKEALGSCFAAVAGSPDAESFGENKLQVSHYVHADCSCECLTYGLTHIVTKQGDRSHAVEHTPLTKLPMFSIWCFALACI